MVMRTLIADDERVARNRMRLLCADLDGVDVVGEAADGHDALQQIGTLAPDLILLDIAMPGLDGIAVARALSYLPTSPVVIFCTAYDRHAVAAFDVSAVDYLLKPISLDRLAQAVEKARRWRVASERSDVATRQWLGQIWVPHRGAMLRIAIEDIQRIEAERDYVRVWTSNASYLLHGTLQAIEERLDPTVFLRLRRSMIVRIEAVTSLRNEGLGSWVAVLSDDTSVKIGPTHLKDVKGKLRS